MSEARATILKSTPVAPNSCTPHGPKAEEKFEREAIVAPSEKLWAEVNATIPPGSTGEIHVPAAPGATITEGGAVVWRGGAFVRGQSGLSGASVQGAFVAFETLSGSYSFVSS